MSGNSDTTKTFYSSQYGFSLSYDFSVWDEISNPATLVENSLLYLYTGFIVNPTEVFYITTPASTEIPTGLGETRIINSTVFTIITTDTPTHQRTYYTALNNKTYVFFYLNYSEADFSKADSLLETLVLF